MNLQFNAAIQTKQQLRLKIKKITFNDNLSSGQLLVKIIYSGICGSQIGEILGTKGKEKYLPHLLGHEAT